MSPSEKPVGLGSFLDFAKKNGNLSSDAFVHKFKDPFLLVDLESDRSQEDMRFETMGYDVMHRHPNSQKDILEIAGSLKIVTVTKRQTSFPGMITVGRAPNNDIQIDSPTLSKLHASLSQDGEGDFFIKDLGSKNRTVVNGDPLREGARAKLSDGDSIFFGPSARAVFFWPKWLCY
ncbi:MAG: FHA domain-containing protein, partial [Planctomycetota bacterium]